MTRRLSNLSGLAAFLVWACGVAATPALGQQNQAGPEIVNETHHDTSIPVRFLAAEGIRPANRIVAPLHRRPGPPLIGSAAEQSAAEQMIQPFAMSRVATTNLLNFDGVSDRDGDAPPDTNASVGATQVVEVTNISYEVFNKATGAPILGPAEVSSIWSGFGGTCGNGSNNFSDPVVIYDKAANRWLVTILGSPDGFFSGVECVAVSSTSDATGSYHRYSFGFGTGNLNDYPKFGVWPDAYYASYNMFGPTTFIGAKVCAYNRAHMLAGLSANAHCFQRSANDFSFLPSDLDGTSLAAAGEPNFFVELFTTTTLHLFKFHVDFVTPANTKFSGPTTVTVNSFTEPCVPTGVCIPQSGTGTKLDSLGDRLMFRLVYRHVGTHESLLAAHSVKPAAGPVAAVRWYEVRSPNATPTVFQQGTFSLSTLAAWMPSIGMDKLGDIAVGFSKSSNTTHPGLGYTGRIPTDPAGMMESAANIFVGAGSQNGGLTRWGDYSSISIDPTDDCTFWYTNEYIPSNGKFNWHTRLASFKFTACH